MRLLKNFILLIILIFIAMAITSEGKGNDIICHYNGTKSLRLIIKQDKYIKIKKNNKNIYINNINNFNKVDDYIIIKEGCYRIIFPLKCSKI